MQEEGGDNSALGIIIPLLQQLLKHHLLSTLGLTCLYQNQYNHVVL